MNNKKVLYISYDGMTDPLGQSQVIPYLQGLTNKGHIITILSFEKKEGFGKNQTLVNILLLKSNITWVPLVYHAKPPLLSTLYDITNMWNKAKELYLRNKYDIVHCRSYISALIGLKLKNKYSIKFLFDMRGLWADERVEGNIWNLKNPVFKVVYAYFKKRELAFLNEADYTISLTNNAKREIKTWPAITDSSKIKVIPCCVDTNLFQLQSGTTTTFKEKLGIGHSDFVITYLGSIGTWYLLDEMLGFFKVLKKHYSTAKFLFLTKDNSETILKKATKIGLEESDFIIQSVAREKVPMYLQLSNLSIFFIKPSYSKKASSPTKMGELLSTEIPIICNSGVGDVDEIIKINNVGILINSFTAEAYEKAIAQYKTMIFSNLRETALEYFSLENGIAAYNEVYENI